VTPIGHICIRDPDTDEIILRQRYIVFEKAPHEPELDPR